MKLLELELANFGALEHRRLQLDHPGPALDLIYGPNEAGKSTTMRAIVALFYGLEHQSADARLFGPDGLRIRARLSDRSGAELIVTRVKGRKATLRGVLDEPLEESRLAGLLGGLPQNVFRTMFGLDHQRLREGGEQLRQGRGELGESLFQAGLGGASVHRLLQELKQEADALFRPTGRLPALNDAIRGYREAARRTREATTRAESFRAQQEQLERDQKRAEELQAHRRALLAEQGRLRRVVRALPGLAKRRELRAQSAALGAVPTLPEGSAQLRLQSQRELDGSQREAKQLAMVIAKLETRRAELDIPQSLAELNPELVRALRNRLGNHLKALEDLPRRRAELRARSDEARVLLRELGSPVALDQLESLRLDRASQAHVAQLASEFGGLSERLAAATRACDAVAAQASQLQAQRTGEDVGCDRDTLARALVLARSAGDLAGRVAALGAQIGLERKRGRQRLSALGLAELEPAALAELPWPSDGLVAEYRERFELGERADAQLQAARAKHDERARDCGQALDALQREGVPPSESELNQARSERDRLWQQLRRALHAAAIEAAQQLLPAFGAAQACADELADRLRREADRVSRQSALLAERESLAAEALSLQQREASLAQQRERLQAQWRAQWSGLCAAPGSCSQMLSVLGKVAALIERAERSQQQEAELGVLEDQARTVRGALAQGLCAAGEATATPDEPLPLLLLRAEKVFERAERLELERMDAQRQLRALSQQRTQAQQQREQAERELDQFCQQWQVRMQQLRLRPDAGVPEALAVLEGRSRLLAKGDEIRQLRARIEAMEEDAKQFKRDVHTLMDRHLFALRDLVVEEAADELVRRYDKACADVAQRARIDRDLAEARGELSDLGRTAAAASEQLGQLQRLAAVDDVAQLESVEQRSEQARALLQSLGEVEDELLRHGEGATIDELAAQAAEQDLDRLRPRLADIEAELEEIDERYREVLHQVGRLQQGLHSLEQDERAADAAADAEQQLSRIKTHGHSYIRRKLAIELLQREIRRYRDANQGPVVERASALFARLTLGQHRGLRVGFGVDDQPVLVSIDAQGRSVQVEALSDGSRDQLYLALRLASLERFIAHREPLPLLLDDALIHFDDDRARAALEVLGEFAATTQVLFFTHHARLLELARQAIPARRLAEHRLSAHRCHPVENRLLV